MRCAASSRPRRCGIDTMSGLDNWSLHQCASHMGHAEPSRQRHEERDRGPFRSFGRDSALVAATAIRVATPHAAPARRARLLMAGRVAGGAGLARPAAPPPPALAGGRSGAWRGCWAVVGGGRGPERGSCIFWPGVLCGIRWPELCAWPSALMPIKTAVAAAIDRNLLIMEGGLLPLFLRVCAATSPFTCSQRWGAVPVGPVGH